MLSIEQLKKALESFDWARVKPLLDAAGGQAIDSADIAEALRRAGDLVIKYPVAAEQQRNALLKSLEQYLVAGLPDAKLPPQIEDAVQTIRVAEAGYRKLVGELSKTDASKLDSTVHVAASIRRAEEEVNHLTAEYHKQAAQRDGITLQAGLLDEFGNPTDMDAVLENCIGFVSMTLQMESFRNKWFDADGDIVVPALPEVTDEAVYQAGSTLVLAVLWRRWQMTEEKARVLGRSLRFLRDDERPKQAPDQLKAFIVDEGDDSSDWLHRVALERVTDKLSQNLVELKAKVNLGRHQPKFILPGGGKALPPHDWVSEDELHALWALEQYLAYDVVSDNERPAGLRLVEWVRGYCVLKKLASEAKRDDLLRTKCGWQDYLAKFGMTAATSEVLLARLTFRRSSRDLFDHPFIKLADGRYRLFATALRSLNVPLVVLSTLSHLSVQLPRKGKSFEVTVKEAFELAGVKAYAFKAKRGGDEFEYDAVVPWGDFLFVIECKNRSLPFGSPVQMHYFDLAMKGHIKQVQRLMRGLQEHPDILLSHFPAEVSRFQFRYEPGAV